ncbi:SDR family oxidoreductase [Bowdeniella massiliensis]|uniref:SDR family oxidoreductase n=1 Tax=Bowdeniella massiliensis TaxID=2932264 RepID=UPI002028E970|nr:SDR family oxidoreductase [Bowdeniella massiliensis]
MTNSRPTALITGASRGIGRAIAIELSTTHDLIVGASSDDSLVDLIAEIPGSRSFVANLTSPKDIARAVSELRLERLDVLVHSAGVVGGEHVAETPWSEYDRVFSINVYAVAELTRLLLPALREAGGQVIAINSGSGFRSGPGSAVYSGSKFALRALTDALREEERGKVRVSSIHPGRVDTDMQVELQEAAGNTNYDGSIYLRPESVAAAVRLAVDATDEATIEELSIRPVKQ